MSLLRDHGHPDAGLYPLGRVFDEADIVTQRLNAGMTTMGVINQLAVASMLSKEAGEAFGDLLKRLNGN